MKSTTASLLLVASAILVGCQESDSAEKVLAAAAIESSDQCHLCGMVISAFEGPKGELAVKGDEVVSKFCSTRDLFGYYLQPENKHRAKVLYVHDMSVTPWESPDDDHFINAQDAYYVWGASRLGAMGETLGSFSVEADAHAFINEFGGKMYRFDDITLELLTQPMTMNMTMEMDMNMQTSGMTGMSSDSMSH